MRTALVAVLLAIALTDGAALAQSVSGSIHGRAVIGTTEPAVGVRVTVTGVELLGSRGTVTDPEGYFQIAALPPGEYTVRLVRIGYRPVTIERAAVQIGRTTALAAIPMEPQPVELGAVRITARQRSLDPTHTDVGATLTAADYSMLPGERDYKSIITILPHVNESTRGDPANSAGSTGLENMYFIDGVNVTAPLNAASGTSLPYNFVRAVEVKTGGYEAQYGRALGAVVNAVTYSGTDEFEGNVFAFMTQSRLAAGPRAEPTLRQVNGVSYDVGARIGGPLLRDRLWYSAAYNPRIERANREIAGAAAFEDRRTAQVFAGKLTWQPNRATSAELSVFGDPTVHDAVSIPPDVPATYVPLNPDPYLTRLETGGIVGSLRMSVALGNTTSLEASVARYDGRDSDYGSTEIAGGTPFFRDDVSATMSGGRPFSFRANVGRSAAVLRATSTFGRHTIISGIEYENGSVSREAGRTGGFTIVRNASGYTTIEEVAKGTLHNRVPTVYLQDSWRVVDGLTLNGGLRWSSQTLTGASGDVAQRFPNEWQPRGGVVWQPGSSKSQRVVASFGRFYQQIPLNLSTVWYLDHSYIESYYDTDPRLPGSTPHSSFDGGFVEEDSPRNIAGLQVEHSDELTGGYEHLLGGTTKLAARAIRRELQSSFQWGVDPSNPRRFFVLGTPGKGELDFLPRPVRRYTALELSADGTWKDATYRGSYVLSRNWGNTKGLYESDLSIVNPGLNALLFARHQAVNSTGLLPNDRTHVIKLAASRAWRSNLTTGAVFTWASGTPRNTFAAAPPSAIGVNYAFVVPRGSAGRTPSLWDLDVRIAYESPQRRSLRPRVVLDVLQVGNPQRAVHHEELLYLTNAEGAFSDINSGYGRPISYQRPMMARLGLEFDRGRRP